MAIQDYVKIVLCLKPEEIQRLRNLLSKEAESGEVWALIMRVRHREHRRGSGGGPMLTRSIAIAIALTVAAIVCLAVEGVGCPTGTTVWARNLVSAGCWETR